jgi:4-hydroxybenzoate polyprenyltransferase
MMRNLLIALRPKQWVKNLFIFLPLIFGKMLFVFPANLRTVLAFCLFSMIASTGYLLNDMIDAERDRLHPVKSKRPIAAGTLSVRTARAAAVVLGTFSILLSFLLKWGFGWVVIVYFAFNLVYSRILKNVVIIDVFCIAGFFMLRILAGGIVADVRLSQWIVFMTGLLALFLGFIKRRQEIKMLEEKGTLHRDVLARYSIGFIDQMIGVVTSSIVVVYILYTIDAATVAYFGTKSLVYSVPFVYYGIFRYLYLIYKHNENGDPTHILLSDSKMQINLVLWILVCIAIIYFRL